MATPGSPTPGEAPLFRDHLPEDYAKPDLNPHVRAHMEFGPPVLTATEAHAFKGRWSECFGRSAPLILEIGSGNGFFLTELSETHPENDHLGVEIRYKRVILTAKKLVNAGVTNVRIARYDAWSLTDLFDPGDLHGVWINHPDPWPKERHEKNRLLCRSFLETMAVLIRPGGFLRVKSDTRYNCERVQRFLDQDLDGNPLPRLPFEVVGWSDDVNHGAAPWGKDIETNYQRKFKARGEPVYAIDVVHT